jgi:hypothetical protein
MPFTASIGCHLPDLLLQSVNLALHRRLVHCCAAGWPAARDRRGRTRCCGEVILFGAKRSLFPSTFPMFVRSLSW